MNEPTSVACILVSKKDYNDTSPDDKVIEGRRRINRAREGQKERKHNIADKKLEY